MITPGWCRSVLVVVATAIGGGCGSGDVGAPPTEDAVEPPVSFTDTSLASCEAVAPVGNRDAVVRGYDEATDDVSLATVVSSVEGATEMRLGNTAGELRLSRWEPYVNRRLWYLRGERAQTLKLIYTEFRGPTLALLSMTIPVRYCVGGLDARRYPPIEVPDSRASDHVRVHDFGTWHQRWSTYQVKTPMGGATSGFR